jgi:hypothetical protein
MTRIRLGDIDIELKVDESLAPSVLRAFAGCTPRDAEVDSLGVHEHPMWLQFCKKGLSGKPLGSSDISVVGGIRINLPGLRRFGMKWWRATWPFAVLKVTDDRLEVDSFVGRYRFHPEQVRSIEQYGRIPLFTWGIQVKHNVKSYPSVIVFFCPFMRPKTLIARIENIGFHPEGKRAARKQQKH